MPRLTKRRWPEYAGIDPYGLLDWEEGDNIERLQTEAAISSPVRTP